MNILKLYFSRWTQNVIDEHGKLIDHALIFYSVLYERINHEKYKQINIRIEGPANEYIDDIDNMIFDELNNSLQRIPFVTKFYSRFIDFILLEGDAYLSRPWATKLAAAKNFFDIDLSTRTNRIASLATRITISDKLKTRDSVINNFPRAINLDIDGEIPTLIRADFD